MYTVVYFFSGDMLYFKLMFNVLQMIDYYYYYYYYYNRYDDNEYKQQLQALHWIPQGHRSRQ